MPKGWIVEPNRNPLAKKHDKLIWNAFQRLKQKYDFYQKEKEVKTNLNEPIGRVDCILRDKLDRNRYLLLEVKPRESEVKYAIGQLQAYRKWFSNEMNIDENNIMMCIATPEVSPTLAGLLAELGIDYIEIKS